MRIGGELLAQPEIVARWLDVWDGSLELNKYLALFTEDVEFRDAQSGRVGRSRAELAEVARPFTQLSDTSVSLVRYATNVNEVFLEVELNAKAPSGDPVKSPRRSHLRGGWFGDLLPGGLHVSREH